MLISPSLTVPELHNILDSSLLKNFQSSKPASCFQCHRLLSQHSPAFAVVLGVHAQFDNEARQQRVRELFQKQIHGRYRSQEWLVLRSKKIFLKALQQRCMPVFTWEASNVRTLCDGLDNSSANEILHQHTIVGQLNPFVLECWNFCSKSALQPNFFS